MFDKFIKKIIVFFPKGIQNLYYKYESAWLYIFFGGLTTLVSVFVQFLSTWLGASTALSTSISWICAVTFAFFTNKTCVFKSKTDTKKALFTEMLQFYGARLVSYFLELGFMLIMVDALHFNTYIMKLFAQVFVLLINYLFSKFVIFKKNTAASDDEAK